MAERSRLSQRIARSALSLDHPLCELAEATGQQIARERAKPPAATAFINCSMLGVAQLLKSACHR
jgi:hypothetical protein